MNFHTTFSEIELLILQERARRAAASAENQGEDELLSVLILTICNERYAVPIDLLTAVYEGIPVISVPCTPTFVSGIANVRGHMISVLDLGLLLGVPGAKRESWQMLIVVSNEILSLGYSIDQIENVQNFTKTDLAAVPANFESGQAAYIRGILPDGTALLDIHVLLNDSRIMIEDN